MGGYSYVLLNLGKFVYALVCQMPMRFGTLGCAGNNHKRFVITIYIHNSIDPIQSHELATNTYFIQESIDFFLKILLLGQFSLSSFH